MEKIGGSATFKDRQNIVLDGFDPISAGGFTQIPNCVLNDTKISLSAKVIYAKLLSYAWHNQYVFPGQERMAQDVGAGKRTIVRAVAELEKVGYLEVQRRGQGLTNIYTLHFTIRIKHKKRSWSVKLALLEVPKSHL